jgi:hypothetical protein
MCPLCGGANEPTSSKVTPLIWPVVVICERRGTATLDAGLNRPPNRNPRRSKCSSWDKAMYSITSRSRPALEEPKHLRMPSRAPGPVTTKSISSKSKAVRRPVQQRFSECHGNLLWCGADAYASNAAGARSEPHHQPPGAPPASANRPVWLHSPASHMGCKSGNPTMTTNPPAAEQWRPVPPVPRAGRRSHQELRAPKARRPLLTAANTALER